MSKKISDEIYKQKYLKYKFKYLSLKGGTDNYLSVNRQQTRDLIKENQTVLSGLDGWKLVVGKMVFWGLFGKTCK